MIYQISQVKDHSRQNSARLLSMVRTHEPALQDQDIGVYGVFSGLFGLASNEVYVVTNSSQKHSLEPLLKEPGLELEANHVFVPTVRPIDHTPRQKPDAQVQGLFAEPLRRDVFGHMLLSTRYDSLAIWEASRHPAPQARENFRRRNTITLEARPIATQLMV